MKLKIMSEKISQFIKQNSFQQNRFQAYELQKDFPPAWELKMIKFVKPKFEIVKKFDKNINLRLYS